MFGLNSWVFSLVNVINSLQRVRVLIASSMACFFFISIVSHKAPEIVYIETCKAFGDINKYGFESIVSFMRFWSKTQ